MKKSIDDVTQGFLPDPVNIALPEGAFNDSRNFRFRDAAIEKFKGQTATFGSLSITPIWAMNIADGTAAYWMYANESVVYATDSNTHAQISSLTYSADTDLGYTGAAFHGFAVVTDTVAVPQTWVPGLANKLIPLVNWPSTLRCKVIRSFGNFLVALRITEDGVYNPRALRWSDIAGVGALPGSWDYTDPTNFAGRTDLGDNDDYLVDCLALRDSNIVYKQFETWLMQPIQTNDSFLFRKVFSETGLLSENCVRAFGSNHFVVTDSDIVLHDGASMQSLADGRVRRWLFNAINQERYERIFVAQNYREREMWVCFPENGHDWPNLALTWNWQANKWAVRELGYDMSTATNGTITGAEQTFAGLTGSFDDLEGAFDDTAFTPFQKRMVIFRGSALRAYQVEQGENLGDGLAMTCYATRDNMQLTKDVGRIKRVKRIFPKIIGTVGDTILVQVGSRSTPDGSVTWNAGTNFVIGTDYKVDCRVSGRWIAVRFQYNGGNSVRLAGFDVEFENDGYR